MGIVGGILFHHSQLPAPQGPTIPSKLRDAGTHLRNWYSTVLMHRALPDPGLAATLVWSLLCLAAPAAAATPEAAGVPNFHRVDEHLSRGGQPNAEGWKSLAQLGVKTVIDLRPDGETGGHSTAAEARAVEAAGMRYVNVPMNGMSAPSAATIDKLLSLFDSQEPVFVHCRYGKDRTGTAVACYRIAHDSWPNQKALEEARTYGIHWFEMGMKRYILGYHTGIVPASAQATAVPAFATAGP